MSQLADHVLKNPPIGMLGEIEKQWNIVTEALQSGSDLETAMSSADLDASLEDHVIQLIAELLEPQE
jgi:hypothetical protein